MVLEIFLFLGLLFSFSLSLSFLLLLADHAFTQEAGGGHVLLEELVGLRLLDVSLGDLAGGGGGLDGDDLRVAGLLGGLLLFGGGVTLSGLLADGEEDELGEVRLEAVGVGLQGLLGDVLTAGVDGDTDGGGVAGGDAGGADLFDGEAAAEAVAHVVADGGAGDGGLEVSQGAGEDLLGLLEAEAAAGLGLLGLVKEGLVVTLLRGAGGPVLALMDLRDGVVTLSHF